MIDTQNRDRQLQSSSYRIAAMDQDFILSDSQRGLRFQLEYEKAEEVLRTWGIRLDGRRVWQCSGPRRRAGTASQLVPAGPPVWPAHV